MNLCTIALVGLGGFLGAVLRFLVYEMSFKISSFLANATNMQFVSLLATLFVNIIGSFALGFLFAYVQNEELRLFSKDILMSFLAWGFWGHFLLFLLFLIQIYFFCKMDYMVNCCLIFFAMLGFVFWQCMVDY